MYISLDSLNVCNQMLDLKTIQPLSLLHISMSLHFQVFAVRRINAFFIGSRKMHMLLQNKRNGSYIHVHV